MKTTLSYLNRFLENNSRLIEVLGCKLQSARAIILTL